MKRLFLFAAAALLAAAGAVSAAETPAKVEQVVFSGKRNFDLRFHQAVDSPPFVLDGFYWRKKGEPLWRYPAALLDNEKVNANLRRNGRYAAGGVIRFKTDSRYIAVRPELTGTAEARFDILERTPEGFRFRGSTPFRGEALAAKPLLNPPWGKIPEAKPMREWVVYLPLFSDVKSVEIGLEPDAKIEAPTPYRVAKPIVFYGSSITHGVGSSRPANTYPALLCRKLDAPMLSVAVAGGCRAELEVADALAEIDAAVFVMDYEHNSRGYDYLLKTHEPFFRRIREKRPDMPILVLSKGDNPNPQTTAVIRATVENAKKRGDRNVWFIDGATYFAEFDDPLQPTVDGCHPTDLGFYAMYRKILPVLQEILQNR